MNSNEAKIQLNSLIEHFKHGGLDFNATDISAIEILLDENKKYKEVINKAITILGNYKHYSVPDEEQNSANEDLVNKVFDILKEVEHEKSNN